MTILLVAAGLPLALLWIGLGILTLRGARQVRALKDLLPADAPGDLPALSVVVTARDEAAHIEATVRSLLRQRYAGLEVIVVDDRSADGTGEILDRLAAADRTGRLVVIHNRALPEGWLGKCHACRVGAERARGAWLLLSDGDVELPDDDLLGRVVGFAERERLDHVGIFPDLRPMSILQAALVSVFGQIYLLGARAFEMDRDRPRGGGGVGAFNLVRRAAYDRVGGHELLKFDLADDFKLGRLLKESGARQRLYNGMDLIRCPWHRGTLNVLRGLEKNLFAGFGFSLLEVIVATAALLALAIGPAALAIGAVLTPAAIPAAARAAALLPLILQAGFVLAGYRAAGTARAGFSPAALTALYPPAVLLILVGLWNSAIVTLYRGGVRWRDTFYPLAALRAGMVPPGAGRRPPSPATPGLNRPGGPPRRGSGPP